MDGECPQDRERVRGTPKAAADGKARNAALRQHVSAHMRLRRLRLHLNRLHTTFQPTPRCTPTAARRALANVSLSVICRRTSFA